VQSIAVSLAFGIALVVLGGMLIAWHCRMWNSHRNDSTVDDREMRRYRSQFRRRLQISGMLILLGVLIPLWDALTTFGRLTGHAAALWIIGMLLVTLWIMLLAALDWVAGRVQRRAHLAALSGLARKRQELEAEVARLRRPGRNGHQ
jgi:hypothetical protein